MKHLHLTPVTPEKLITPIGPDNEDFVLKVVKEYDVPFDELCRLIRNIIDLIDNILSAAKEYVFEMNENYFDKLLAPDVEIKGISIMTNKGTVKIKSSHYLFDQYFYRPIQKMRLSCDKKTYHKDSYYSSWIKNIIFKKIVLYFTKTSLGEFQKRVAIGLFLVHFKLYKGKPYLTEQEFKANPTEALSYKHYLSDIVKARLKIFD